MIAGIASLVFIPLLSIASAHMIWAFGGTSSDLLIVNKTDLAPHVGADLMVMEKDTQQARNGRTYVFSDLSRNRGLDEIIAFVERHGGLVPAERVSA